MNSNPVSVPNDNIRLRQIVEKLTWPENAYCRRHLEQWIHESDEWARKHPADGYEIDRGAHRLLYVLNHLCPNLAHRCKKPPAYLKADDPEYVRMMREYLMENSQAEFLKYDGSGEAVIEQPGVLKTNEAWVLFLQLVAPIIGQE